MYVLIDPFSRSVALVSIEGDFLEGLHRHIQADSVECLLIRPNVAMFVDAMGLRRDVKAFWQWADGDIPIEGRAVLTGVGSDGLPAPVYPVPVDEIARKIVWIDLELERVEETIGSTLTPNGPSPVVVRHPIWKPAPERPPIGWWSVVQGESEMIATRHEITANGTNPTGEVVKAADLDEITKLLPEGVTRFDPKPSDDPRLVASFMEP